MEAKNTSKMKTSPYYIRTVTVFPERLYIASMAKENLSIHMHTLVKVLFLSKSKGHFISLTDTPDEISLILTEESIKQFPNDSIKVAKEKPWLAIQFSMGSSPSETQGFIGDIAAPLGQAGINIFYLTTFNSDYILVEESKYQAARLCIESNFPIVWMESEVRDLSANQVASPRPESKVGLGGIIPETFPKLQAFPDLPLILTRISGTKLEGSISDLIKLIFYPTNAFRFLSFTQTEEEVSLIVDTRTLAGFPKEGLVVLDDKIWVPIMRVQKSGLTETGVVGSIASPLTNMSMLYLSSFKTGWFMVTKDDYNRATQKLQENGFVVSTKRQEKRRKSLEWDKASVVEKLDNTGVIPAQIAK